MVLVCEIWEIIHHKVVSAITLLSTWRRFQIVILSWSSRIANETFFSATSERPAIYVFVYIYLFWWFKVNFS